MTIELQFNSMMIDIRDIEEKYPELATMIYSYLPQGKPVKRRKRKKRKTVAYLIDQIIETINS